MKLTLLTTALLSLFTYATAAALPVVNDASLRARNPQGRFGRIAQGAVKLGKEIAHNVVEPAPFIKGLAKPAAKTDDVAKPASPPGPKLNEIWG